MNLRFVLIIYNILFPVVLCFLLPRYLLKIIRRGNYSKSFGERLGIFSSEKQIRLSEIRNPIWIHAVSVGEVNVAKKLIKSLKSMEFEQAIILSTTTPTGHSVAKNSDADLVIYHPLDFLFIVKKVIKKINPQSLVLTEGELWPNLINEANKRGVKVSIVNARLSKRSESRYKMFSFLSAPLLKVLNLVCVQYEKDRQTWESLGVDLDRTVLTGSIKFDEDSIQEFDKLDEFRDILNIIFREKERKIILAGSTHLGEELMIAKKYKELKKTFPNLFYIVVPRHAERCDFVFDELSQEGINVALRSEFDKEIISSEIGDDIDCLIIDSTGELNAWYFLSDIVIIGKSFLSNGGQNPVEAIFAGKPVIVGPNMENFSTLIAQLIQNNAIKQIDGPEMIVESVSEILLEPEKTQKMVSSANDVLSFHRGSSKRTAEIILNKSL